MLNDGSREGERLGLKLGLVEGESEIVGLRLGPSEGSFDGASVEEVFDAFDFLRRRETESDLNKLPCAGLMLALATARRAGVE